MQKNNNNADSSNKPVLSESTVNYARKNSKLAVVVSIASMILTLVSIIASSWINRNLNFVAAVPVGDVWEYPMVHWVNAPNRYEEDAKPMHVAQRFVRALYEVDPLDYSSVSTSRDFTHLMLSNRIAELLAYTIPGTSEHMKVNYALEQSQTTYQIYSECKCVKRFLISDMIITRPPAYSIQINMIGRFVIFGQDGRRPLAAEDLGIKSIVLHMINDISLFDRSEGGPDAKPEIINAEGWYVVRSHMSTITPSDLQLLRQVRTDINMKGAY